jgi:hypothetical protein
VVKCQVVKWRTREYSNAGDIVAGVFFPDLPDLVALSGFCLVADEECSLAHDVLLELRGQRPLLAGSVPMPL